MILSIAPWGSPSDPLPLWLVGPSVLAVVAYGVALMLRDSARLPVRVALLAGWVAHAVAIVFDTTSLGTGQTLARFGFAPALSVTLWLVLAVYLVESRFVPLTAARRGLAGLGVAAVVLAWFFPGEVRPQLSRWAPSHWVLGIASYGLFGVAILHAVLLQRADRQMRQKSLPLQPIGLPVLQLERLTFRFVAAGFAVLTAALVLGVWFADPWRWDHKAIFSLLGWAVLAGLLAGRRVFGWRGVHAIRWLYAGAVLLLLAYVGSRFVLEVLLPASP